MTVDGPETPPAPPAPSPHPPGPHEGPPEGHEAAGVLIGVLGLVLLIPVGIVAALVGEIVDGGDGAMVGMLGTLMAFGVAQLLYVIPIGMWLVARGYRRTANGLWITAGVLFLINSACWGLLFTGIAVG